METKNYDKYLIIQDDHTLKAHSCGILLLKKNQDSTLQYLILEKPQKKSVGLPKGHLEYGETIIETARRELFEETGLKDGYDLATDFVFEDVVFPAKHQKSDIKFEKKITIFLGKLITQQQIVCNDHEYKWIDFNSAPPDSLWIKKLLFALGEYERKGNLERFLNLKN